MICRSISPTAGWPLRAFLRSYNKPITQKEIHICLKINACQLNIVKHTKGSCFETFDLRGNVIHHNEGYEGLLSKQ